MTTASPPEAEPSVAELRSNRAPESKWLTRALALAGALVSAIYLANMGAGFVELIPDNIPVAGNIDEVLFTLLLIYCLRRLGIELPHLRSRENRSNLPP